MTLLVKPALAQDTGASPYTVINGSDEQLVNINADGVDIDAGSYKDGVDLTSSELLTLLDGASFGERDVAVFPDLTGVQAAKQIKRITLRHTVDQDAQ